MAARAGHTFYTHTAGAPSVREAIADKIRELQGVSYRPSEVMATVGGTMLARAELFQAIDLALAPRQQSSTYVVSSATDVRAVMAARVHSRHTAGL